MRSTSGCTTSSSACSATSPRRRSSCDPTSSCHSARRSINTGEGFGNTAHFSLAVALGLKYYFNEHLGLRAEVHYIPVYLYSSGESDVWLCIDDFCWDTGSRFLQQFDLRAGATFRF